MVSVKTGEAPHCKSLTSWRKNVMLGWEPKVIALRDDLTRIVENVHNQNFQWLQRVVKQQHGIWLNIWCLRQNLLVGLPSLQRKTRDQAKMTEVPCYCMPQWFAARLRRGTRIQCWNKQLPFLVHPQLLLTGIVSSRSLGTIRVPAPKHMQIFHWDSIQEEIAFTLKLTIYYWYNISLRLAWQL